MHPLRRPYENGIQVGGLRDDKGLTRRPYGNESQVYPRRSDEDEQGLPFGLHDSTSTTLLAWVTGLRENSIAMIVGDVLREGDEPPSPSRSGKCLRIMVE